MLKKIREFFFETNINNIDPEWEELFTALDRLDLEKVKKIIKKYPERIDQKILIDLNPLQYICFREFMNMECCGICNYLDERYRIIKFLIEAGANVSIDNGSYKTPLLTLCRNFNKCMPHITNDRAEILIKTIEMLLNYGVDPNTFETFGGRTALHNLLMESKYHKSLIKIVKILIERGADVNLKSSKKMGDKLAIELLFSNLFKNNDKNTREISEEIIKIMIENGLNIEKLKCKYEPLKLLFVQQLENENKKLRKEIEELRYKPGNPGYREAMDDFDKLIDVKKNE